MSQSDSVSPILQLRGKLREGLEKRKLDPVLDVSNFVLRDDCSNCSISVDKTERYLIEISRNSENEEILDKAFLVLCPDCFKETILPQFFERE